MEERFKKIKAFAFDVDGVLTDGGILANLDGELFRTFDSKDGFGLRMASMHGYKIGIITGGRSESIRKRFITCGVTPEDVYLGSRDKMEDFEDFCFRYNLAPENVMYFGDDVPDVEVIRAAGIGVCPSDAAIECKEAADIVSDRPGGKALVRKHIEEVMRLQGTWTFDSHAYAAKYKATKE